MPHADTLTVIHHDDTRTTYTGVTYRLLRDEIHVFSTGGQHTHTDVLMTQAYRHSTTLPGCPVLTAGQAGENWQDIVDGRRWPALPAGDPTWRPSPRTPELTAQLTADDRAEDDGADSDDRATCHTHQSWTTDCVSDPSHSNPASGYNWCPQHRSPVQACQCRPATVDTPPAVPVLP